jgi:5-methyltetrahydrofolate--homocysteine methyltransferase
MIKTLTDRLAEAFAEQLHAQVRKLHWGYSKEENMDMGDILNVKY